MGRIKARVSINLPKDLVEKARGHNLNISKVAEVALIHETNQLEKPTSQNNDKGGQ
jgi:post-segregation antitoxin (ccd killing protein)